HRAASRETSNVNPAPSRSSSERSRSNELLPIFVSYCQTFCAPPHALPPRTCLARPTPESWTRYGIPSLPTAGAAFHSDPADTVNSVESASKCNQLACALLSLRRTP